MALIDEVRAVLDRLATHGWQELLGHHGLDIRASDLAAELQRELLGIDRSLDGFDDLASGARRGIEPGNPARSLLYHALASPMVTTTPDGTPLSAYPTLAELNLVENLVFGLRPPSLAELRARFPGVPMAIGVFASEYRSAGATVGRRHADVCLARTGVTRIGTHPAAYHPELRGFLPFVDDAEHAVRVLPARYSAWIAVQLTGDPAVFGPMNPDLRVQLGDGDGAQDADRRFWVPLHKLFCGAECLRGYDLTVRLHALHRNEKLRRVHRELRARGHDTGWAEPEINQPPFTFTTDIAELSDDPEFGPGVLVPVPHGHLVTAAERDGEPLTFQVPADAENPWAPSLTIAADGRFRSAPEYVHVRHVVRPDGTRVDLNDEPDVAAVVRQGGYRAVHYLDFSGDGAVRAECPELAVELPRSVPAYSLVTAPDFYPHVDQRELIEWWIERVPARLRGRIWQTPPLTLSDERLAPNLELRDLGVDFRAEDDSVTAIVSLPADGGAAAGPVPPRRAGRSGCLPDAAAGVFAPGWDTSVDRTDNTAHLASYGLGSPFPEDAKLCAALSSFWPAVAPDAGRTFSLAFPTATPLTDAEIGILGDLPWDGYRGPHEVNGNGNGNGDGNGASGGAAVLEYASFDHVDYVESALGGEFSLALTGRVDTPEYEARILAVARTYLALRIEPGNRRWRLLSFLVAEPGDEARSAAEGAAGVTLPGRAYRLVFGLAGTAAPDPADHRQVRIPMQQMVTAFAGAGPTVLVNRDGDWTAVRTG